ncbi:hypothetical protein D1631_05425 [Chryseobacterium nematophagum]|uniref:DUF3945 domain-containing protein n=1 Tax=Chryseobacterium nematophagum TaxID=2305228 RepID=A0A3M7TD56_9FLAO|nr:hypothetical protein [Chryseobacterium nematophagum]RNA61411.1 hypothetical protein D1631_05425 [Chryseobacterium nematophagum]
MEKQLSWSDRVIIPKTRAYKDFINKMENTSPEEWFRDGERIFTEKEEKFMRLYHYNKKGLEKTPVVEKENFIQKINEVEGNKLVYDDNFFNEAKNYINDINNQKNMENQKDFNQLKYLKDQLKYLGFGESEKFHKDIESGINSAEKNFEIKTTSDKVLPGNSVEFDLKFDKSEQGGVFLNSYTAILSNDKNESIFQNFKVSKGNTFTAKEAINLLEGRSVKMEFVNPKTNEKEPAFVKLDLNEEKNQYGNYNYQTFYKNYGIDTTQIIEKANLIFDKAEYKDSTIQSLEKGNVVKVKFELEDKTVEGKAVLNPQYKTLNFYDSNMNRINTNKPLQGIENHNKNGKSNAREHNMSRGI